jgi:hypothetical protein
MDFYRIAVVKAGLLRVIDLPATELPRMTQEARLAGWQVSFVLLPRDAALLPGTLEEPVDLVKH